MNEFCLPLAYEFIHLYVQQPMPPDMPDQRELLKRRQWRIMFVEARKTQCEEVASHFQSRKWHRVKLRDHSDFEYMAGPPDVEGFAIHFVRVQTAPRSENYPGQHLGQPQ